MALLAAANPPLPAHTVAGAHVSARSVFGYGLGDFANNLAFALSTAFLLYYYTDVAGLSAAAIGTMFLVVRLWDAFADLFAGRVVDRTMTRWGKFRPFILFGAVPLMFLSYLTFHVPSGISDSAKLLYAYLTYAVLGLLYSLVNVPYGSLASAMTQSVHQRAKLVSARAFGAAVGGIILSFIIAPQISDLRAQKADMAPGEYQEKAQAVVTQTTLLLILIGSVAYLLVFLLCREASSGSSRASASRTPSPRCARTSRWPTSAPQASSTSSVSSPSVAPPLSTPSTCSVTSNTPSSSPS